MPGIALTTPQASGYAAVPTGGGGITFTRIRDSYTVPAADCLTTPDGVAQQWAGFDGIGDPTIEHVGVSEACQGGVASYFAWYQMYPAPAVLLFHPSPGDKLNTSASVSAGVYTFVIDDLTTSKTYTGTATCVSCHNSSAHVTVGPRDPADFVAVHFTGIVVTDSGGVSGGLSNPAWSTIKLVQPPAPNWGVAKALSTVLVPPPPHSAFTDLWM